MDDWSADASSSERARRAASRRARAGGGPRRPSRSSPTSSTAAKRPALVVGAGADDPETWVALVALAERLACPVWQESFSARAGFPQDHPLFAGHLPADRHAPAADARARTTSCSSVGAPVFRQYPFDAGPFVEPGTRVAMVSQDPAEVHRSAADLAVLAPPAAGLRRARADRARARRGTLRSRFAAPAPPAPPAAGEPLRAGHVFAALAERLPRDAIVIEESPSNRPELLARLPARESLGFLSPAMGGLGFALPAATGLRMARPDRPVVAIVGDGVVALLDPGALERGALPRRARCS